MKKILVCVDNNPLNEAVCSYGLEMAKKLNLEVIFLHVIKTPLFTPNFLGLAAGGLVVTQGSDMVYDPEELKPTKEQIDEAEDMLKKAKKMADEADIKSSSDLQCGDIIEILINYSDIAAIVVSIKDETEDIQNNIIALTRESKTPILFVNKEFSEIKSALVAFDGGDAAIKTLHSIKDSKIFGQDLEYHVLNINKDEKKSKEILDIARDILKNENAKFVSLSGEVADELISYRRANNLDLFVMGSFSKGIFATLFFGSTSKNVVEKALVPVFVAQWVI